MKVILGMILLVSSGCSSISSVARMPSGCSPSVEIKTAENYRALRESVECIEGNLAILVGQGASPNAIVDLPRLKYVTGTISFSGGLLGQLRMSELESAGDIEISPPSYPQIALNLVYLPKLEKLTGAANGEEGRINLAFAPALKRSNVTINKAVESLVMWE
jgi:hypothetical protein